MENVSRFGLSQYYRDLQAVEKSLQTKKPISLQSDKPKTFLKQKSQLPIRNTNDISKRSKRNQMLPNRLSLDIQKYPSQPVKSTYLTGIPLKYLQNADESRIDNNFLDNSIITKQQNKKIILQIHGLELEDEDKSTIKYNYHGQRKKTEEKSQVKVQAKSSYKDIQQQLKTVNIFDSEKTTQKILETLQHRNKIYEMVKQYCKEGTNLQAEFQSMWKRYQMYEKFIKKLNKIGCKI